MSIALLDIGLSNVTSVCNTLNNLEVEYVTTNNVNEIESSKTEALIIPGVGTFGAGMERLKHYKLVSAIQNFAKTKPILGICLGMQLFFESSEESPNIKGLSLLSGVVKKMERKKLPTIGWCQTDIVKGIPYFTNGANQDFYYIHTYSCIPKNSGIINMKTIDGVVAGIQSDNIFGYQFHPEKSQQGGAQLMKSFIEYAKHR